MVNRQWSLFLDRDGVINERIIGSYVSDTKQFIIKDDFLSAIKILRPLFGYIFVVTNQQGIGKGLMTEDNLHDIHDYLKNIMQKEDVFLDGIYHCPHLETENCDCRKPNIGMAEQIKRDFPTVNFKKSVMVGDALSDILFGKRCGMVTAFIGDEMPDPKMDAHLMPDYFCQNLLEFAHLIEK